MDENSWIAVQAFTASQWKNKSENPASIFPSLLKLVEGKEYSSNKQPPLFGMAA